jgi:acetyl-CoA acetyltransferase
MREAVICEPVRTPIGRYGGMFKSLTAVDLGVTALGGLMERTGIAPDEIDDVILGHCNANSEAPAIGRVVALDAGLPIEVTGFQLDRRCGSGLQAVINAVMQVHTGVHDVVVAGGRRPRRTSGASTPSPARSRTSWRCSPTGARSPHRSRVCSPRRSCPSQSRPARVTR